MARYTPAAKLRLSLSLEALRKYGTEGQRIADELLKQTPPDAPEFDRDIFFVRIVTAMRTKQKSK